jgi:hypothetical protein
MALPSHPKQARGCQPELDTVCGTVDLVATEGDAERQLTQIPQMAKQGKVSKVSKVGLGTKIAAQMRAEANKLTDEQRDESMSFAMQVIYGKGKTASHAVRH